MAPERGAQPVRAPRPRARQPQSYPRITAAAAAAMAGDEGRRVQELPWLYLDRIGQEFGPVPGCTMHEWLAQGRFPVGSDLRVRLPEWERHLPLHQLYPDLSVAFVLPPAWPDLHGDGTPTGAGEPGGPRPAAGPPSDGAAPSHAVGGAPLPWPPAVPTAPGAPAGGSALAQSNHLSAASPESVLERLLQRSTADDPMLPKPPPQPSYARLQDLFSQPQEGPPVWEQ